ncbi:hypothetical protein SAMN04489842_1781 [Natronobacterium texcoconense]|uniref:Uncharacterized protein n=1 Tax=Natronobacterium texcoconense TaxID=1095778 RepID=A0A1H1F1L0_NATTX|nr:hypothetical protein SAMN04489842_1781 [Natronobacterium texcoconense]
MHYLWSKNGNMNPGESEEKLDPDGLMKQQIQRLVNELMRHVCPKINFQRRSSRWGSRAG